MSPPRFDDESEMRALDRKCDAPDSSAYKRVIPWGVGVSYPAECSTRSTAVAAAKRMKREPPT